MKSNFSQVCLAAATLAFATVVLAPPSQAASCGKIRAEFERNVRPAMLRIAKKNFRRGNWFLVTLKKKHGKDDPTLADINATYQEMLVSCGNDSKCRKYAKDISAASREVYKINRRWVRQGCPGRLDE